MLVLLFMFLFAYFYIEADQNGMMYILFLLYTYVMYKSIRDYQKNITLIMFYVAFFTFLMGRVTLDVVIDTTEIVDVFGFGSYSTKALMHIYVCLFLAILFVYFGYKSKKNNIISPTYIRSDDYVVCTIKKKTKFFIYITFPFVLLVIVEKILFVLRYGYFSFYLDFQSHFPYIVTLIAFSFDFFVIIYLATLPSKKEAKLPMLLYFLVGVISLGTGQRGEFVLNMLLLITYMFIRNSTDTNGEKWITKKQILLLVGMVPVLFLFLFTMAYLRTERESENSVNFIWSFLYQQGVSVDVIGYGYDYKNSFPPGRMYLLGDFIDYFRHNFVAKLLFGASSVEPQSVNHALNDYAYDAALTYYVKPYDYLNGVGLGSCYIAEAWHDLGYFGVMAISFIYGRILAVIPIWCKRNPWIGSAALLMFTNIIYAPRSRADKFLYVFISFVVIFIYSYLYYVTRKTKGKISIQQKSF